MKNYFTKIIVLFISLLFILIVATSAAAQFKITPNIYLSEEYNDNVFLDPSSIAESDWLTTVEPGLTLLWKTNKFDVELDYSLRFLYFKDDTSSDETSFKDIQRGRLASVFFPGHDFNIIAQGEISRVVINERDRTAEENEYVNRATLYNFFINPNYSLRLGPTLELKFGYRYDQSYYAQVEHRFVDDYNDPQDSLQHRFNLELYKKLGPKTSLWTGYFFTDYHVDDNSSDLNPYDENSEDFKRHDIAIGGEQKIGSRLTLTAQAGISYFDFEESGNDTGYTCQAALNYQPSSRLIFEVDYKYNYEPSINRGLAKVEDLTGFIRYHSRFTADLQLFTRRSTYYGGEINLSDTDTQDKSLGATLRLSYPLGRHFKISCNTDYAYWEFTPDDEDVDRYGFGASIDYNYKHLDISLGHTYRINDSDDDLNDFRNNITMLEVSWSL